MAQNMPKPSNRPSRQKRVTINIPKELEATYANVAILSNTIAEIILDFGQVLPHMPTAQVKSRVVMSPIHAKLLHMRLGQQVANYEQQYGEIKLPQSMDIASQFFRFNNPEPESKDDDDEES